jgi:tetrahedral aminopeptidase
MLNLSSFLQNLIQLPGLSGHETPVCQVIETAWETLVDETHTSRLGSLYALRRGTSPQPRPTLLLAAHMDAIGFMVTGIDSDFLHFTQVGGLDPRSLVGQIVTVHGKQDLPGVIVQPPSFLLPAGAGDNIVPLEYLLIDTGLEGSELHRKVRIGDLVSFAQKPIELNGDYLVGHSLDNRASVAAVTACLETLKNRKISWDLWAVATIQEEVTMAGALTAGFELRPTVAVAIDVTFASGPGSPESKTYPFGKGITLGWGPNIHPALYKAFKELADRFEIPYKTEAMAGNSGTDAFGLQIAAEGIPTMVLSIPLRYMHSAVEMVSLKDIERAGRLLAEFATGLQPDFIDSLVWED